jgi:two-component system, LuxR family, sensor kinase FixL
MTPPAHDFREELAHHDTLSEKIGAAQARLDSLASKGAALPPEEQEMVDELLEAFSITLEELRVAGEELYQQNEALTTGALELESLQQRYRNLFELAPGGYFVTDLDGVIHQANQAAGHLLGITPRELAGKPLTVYIAPGQRADFHRRLIRLSRTGGTQEVEWETEMWTRYNAERIVPVLLNGAVMHDAGQPTTGLLWLVRDLSPLKEAQKALMLAEQQALVGRLASSLAHEVGNPLQTVLGCMGLAHEALTADGPTRAQHLLEVGRSELRRAATILHRLRELSRPPEPDETEPTDLNALLARVLLLTAGLFAEHGVKVVWNPAPELPPVEATPDRLRQVFLNLILNAVEAMPEGGALTVRTEAAGTWVRTILADTGVGIDPSELQHLFTPFHTTRTGGMGLGLYVCKQIMDEHQGEITIESQPGQGATFTLKLPVAAA